jgi:hypothetical protein
MADPISYSRTFSFTGYQTATPQNPLPGVNVDVELDEIAGAVGSLVAAVQDVRRSDGKLQNGSVTKDALSPDFSVGFTMRGLWVSGTAYAAGDGVVYGVQFFKAISSHTATNLNRPDLDPTKWQFLFDFTAANAAAIAGKADTTYVDAQLATKTQAYATRAAAIAATVPAAVQTIRVDGYAAAGDGGGAVYKRVGSNPAAPGASFQSVGGVWWLMAPTGPTSVRAFGAVVDGTTDDTAAIQNALNFLSPLGVTTVLGQGVSLIGTVFIPSHATILGLGRAKSTLKVKNALNSTALTNSNGSVTLAASGGNTNITLSDFTIDGNGPGQTVAMYPLALKNIQHLRMYRIDMVRPSGTNMYLSEDDVAGSGPGGKPATPQGQQFNFDIIISDCTFDATTQSVATNADQVVICRVDGLKVEFCTFRGGGANCCSLQFNTNFRFVQNKMVNFFRGIYCESSFKGLIADNDLFGAGVISPVIGDAPYVGIWLSSATESYPGIAYQTSSEIQVVNNRLHDINRQSGTTALIGILVSGRFTPNNAYDVNISNNSLERLTASGTIPIDYIRLEGYVVDSTIRGNIVRGTNNAQSSGIHFGGNVYATTDEMHDVSIIANRVTAVPSGILQNTSPHTGSVIVGNNTRGCTVAGISITNTAQAGYVNSANV